MDEKLSILNLIQKHGRKLLIVFLICFGSGLLFSIKQVFPIFFDMIVINPHFNNQTKNQPVHQPLTFPEAKPVEYNVYLPMVSKKESFEGAAQNQAPDNQANLSITHEDPLLDIGFREGSPSITILLNPDNEQNHAITPVEIRFLPGKQCNFGDGYACINEFTTSFGNRITFLSVHSGYGGDGDALRNLFEGTGINMGLFTRDQVLKNIQVLSGSEVKIKQGDKEVGGLNILSIVRIPPELVKEYISLPVEQSFSLAIELGALDPEALRQDLLVIETCGWQLPDEKSVDGLENTSSSVYVTLITIESSENSNQ